MEHGWMRAASSEYIDIHNELLPYEKVLSFLETIESEYDILKYCNGGNEGGRWIFQVFSLEFVNELTDLIINAPLVHNQSGPILEVMSGNGRLTEFLRPLVKKEIIATDARIGGYDIEYPKWVEKLDAMESVVRFRPSIVLIAWEPVYSSLGANIIDTGVPTIWIGDRENCAVHSGLFERLHIKMNSRYALGRKDSFLEKRFQTDIYLFNWPR